MLLEGNIRKASVNSMTAGYSYGLREPIRPSGLTSQLERKKRLEAGWAKRACSLCRWRFPE
jgi:hypothetical protein